jgi:hypothetical protein
MITHCIIITFIVIIRFNFSNETLIVTRLEFYIFINITCLCSVLVFCVLIHFVNIVPFIVQGILLITVGTLVSMFFAPQVSVLIFQQLIYYSILHEVDLYRMTLLFTKIICTDIVRLVNQHISIIIVGFCLWNQ